jgi:hypothetical protein
MKKGYKLIGLLTGDLKSTELGTYLSLNDLIETAIEYQRVFERDSITLTVKNVELMPAEKYKAIASLLTGLIPKI